MINFSKMQGAGNDFIIIRYDELGNLNPSELAKKMCNRHFGIGADGLMIVANSDKCDVKMLYYNSDGTQAKMCGNGIRCFSKYVYLNNIVNSEFFTVETLDGEKEVEIILDNNGFADLIKVNMGKPSTLAKDVPVNTSKETFIMEKVDIDSISLKVSSILVGVPHTVILVDDIKKYDIIRIGPLLENNLLYPNKTNVNFVQIKDVNNIIVDTWERGAGKTLACGTGVCASAYICYILGKVSNLVNVFVPGGQLTIEIKEDSTIYMKGKAELICEGKYHYIK